ncbi:MAG: hypothetical protein J5I53_10810 [Bradyrhizobiaceae bacterium]|nr:hypothetical protein [Bradyrhizobiaceae bacterium]
MRVSTVCLLAALLLQIHLPASAADSARTQPSHGSSWYLAGGYGNPYVVKTETGYVFGTIASVGFMLNGPIEVDTKNQTMEMGVIARLFLPTPPHPFAPFLAFSYSGNLAPFNGATSNVMVTAGTLYEVYRGIHLRAEFGAASTQVKRGGFNWYGSTGEWSSPSATFAWSLQLEIAFAHL